MTHDLDPHASDARRTPQPPQLEIENYRADLADLELSAEQEREVLLCLWDIVKMVVDAGFGLDAASGVLAAVSREVFAGHAMNDAETTKGKTTEERKIP